MIQMISKEQLLEAIDIGLIVLDRELIVRAWNRWMEHNSNVPAADIVGTSIVEKYPSLGGTKYLRFFKSVLNFGNYAYFSQKLHQYLIPIKSPSSLVDQVSFMQQNCSATPLRDAQGGITGILITIRDVTEFVIYEKKLLEMTKFDGLTHLYSRSYLDKRLSEEMERTRRFGKPFSILMMDIDYFKKINDTHGHLCGDQTLRQLATVIRRVVRKIDIVGRYGGEEFCCILPETLLASACILAERLRQEVAAEPFTFGDKEYGITLSLGVAEYPQDGLTLESLVELADVALYRAKYEGRNRVCCAPAPELKTVSEEAGTKSVLVEEA